MPRSDKENVGMAVRRDVLNCLYHNPNRMVKLPTIQEYARRFGLSPRSVAEELKKLTAENFIIGKQGKGTYTNPRGMCYTKTVYPRLAGLIFSGGDDFSYSPPKWHLLAFAGEELARNGFHVQLAGCGINGNIPLDDLLHFGCCDTVLCVEPKAEMYDTIRGSERVFAVGSQFEPPRGVGFSYGAAIAALKALLNRESRENLLILGNPRASWIQRMASQFRENGFAPESIFLQENHDSDDSAAGLGEWIRARRIQAVAAFPGDQELLESTPESCFRLLLKPPETTSWRGYCFDLPFEEAIRDTVRMMRQYAEGAPSSARQMNVKLIEIKA